MRWPGLKKYAQICANMRKYAQKYAQNMRKKGDLEKFCSVIPGGMFLQDEFFTHQVKRLCILKGQK